MIPEEGVVVVLFTDLVGSTALLARVGDDRSEGVRRAHFGLLRQAVAESEGFEVKNLGDGLMVAFTSPVKAISCAIAMQRAVGDYNERGAGAKLDVRIGLHAGEPVRDENDLFGSPVVVAKRLCDQANGGQILASELVAKLVGTRGGFRFRPGGRLKLKGLPETVPAVFVEWESSPAPPRPSPEVAVEPLTKRRKGPRLVGRERELGMIEAELKRTQTEGLGCLLLVGEPGVGKTRLAHEVIARHRDTALGLSARAHPLGATTSFGLWTEALERHLKTLPPDDIWAVCGGFLDDLASLLYSVASIRGTVPEGEPPRHRLLEGFSVVLDNLAASRPLVVVLDDVHLADASSWEALHYLTDHLAAAPVLIIATARPVELARHEAAAPVLLDLEREGVLTRIELELLGPEGVADLAHALLGRAPPRPLVELLSERTRGNPLYAMGLLRALEEQGANLSAPRLDHVPPRLADQVLARVRGLEEPAQTLLESLAVVGRRVELGELVALTGLELAAMGAVLQALVDQGLIAEESRGAHLSYEIVHPLVQEAIYQAVGTVRRRGLHRSAGRALLAGNRLGEAAPHFARSADVGDSEAIEVLRDALRQAEERGSFREGLAILGALVDILPEGDARWVEVFDALVGRAEWVIDHLGDADAVMGARAMRAIDAVLSGSPDGLKRAAAKFRLATFLAWGTGELDDAERTCADAADLFQANGEAELSLLARFELAALAAHRGRLRALESEMRAVLEAAEAASEPFVTLQAMFAYGLSLFMLGRLDASERCLERSIELARAQQKDYRVTVSLTVLALCRAFDGDIAGAGRRLEEGRTIPSWRDSVLPEWQAIVHWLAGDYPAATAAGAESLTRHPSGLGRRRALGLPFVALSAVEMGDTAEARRYLDEARRAAADSFLVHGPCCLHADGLVAWHQGASAEAIATLHGSAATLLDSGAPHFAAPVLVDLAEVAARADRADAANDAAQELGEIARHLGTRVSQALADLGGAWSILASGAPGRAAEPARRAVEQLEDTGCRAWLARAHDLLGRSLSASDREGAVAAFQTAVTGFEACAAQWRREQTLSALAALGGGGRRKAAALQGPGSLTRRERQVAHLASLGHTVKQIGERLCIGEHTVETHLSNVYAKLGIRSKSELVGRSSEFEA